MENEVKQLTFWYEGESFTDLVQNYIREGRFRLAYKMFGGNGLSDELIAHFFHNNAVFVGDSRNDTFNYKIGTQPDNPITDEDLFAAVNTVMSSKNIEWQDFLNSDEEELWYFDKVYSRQKFWDDFQFEIIRSVGFRVGFDIQKEIGNTGVLLHNGIFIPCGYKEHEYFYNMLYDTGLGLVTAPEWYDCETSIHVSSGMLNGKLLTGLEGRLEGWPTMSQTQFNVLAKHANELEIYGYHSDSFGSTLLRYYGESLDKGGKYNNLSYLKDYFPELNIPHIQLERPEDVTGWCLRTSPKKSMAGILNSVFEIAEDSEQLIQYDYNKFSDLFEGNTLHYFYQKYIEGVTGVAHYKQEGFTYACSENRHDIVDGKVGSVTLTDDIQKDLESITKRLYDYFKCMVQVEFTVTESGEIYVLQLRLMKHRTSSHFDIKTDKSILKGKSFNSGRVELNKEDLLIAYGDMPSEALIGKKGLIVINSDEFSHLLALSYSLGIPSMQLLDGDLDIVELPETFVIDTRNSVGYLLNL